MFKRLCQTRMLTFPIFVLSIKDKLIVLILDLLNVVSSSYFSFCQLSLDTTKRANYLMMMTFMLVMSMVRPHQCIKPQTLRQLKRTHLQKWKVKVKNKSEAKVNVKIKVKQK